VGSEGRGKKSWRGREKEREREREREGEGEGGGGGDGRFIGTVVALFVRGALIEKIRTFLNVREATEAIERDILDIRAYRRDLVGCFIYRPFSLPVVATIGN